MSIFSRKKEISEEEFVAGLLIIFNKMRSTNIETIKKFLTDMIQNMSKDELMKLDWELSILDMFNITYCCRLFIGNEEICDKVLDLFHKKIYKQFLETSSIAALAFQDESNLKYKAYFEALRSSDPKWNLCKQAWRNILGKPCESSVEMAALSIYFESNQRYTLGYFKNMVKNFNFSDEWKINKSAYKIH